MNVLFLHWELITLVLPGLKLFFPHRVKAVLDIFSFRFLTVCQLRSPLYCSDGSPGWTVCSAYFWEAIKENDGFSAEFFFAGNKRDETAVLWRRSGQMFMRRRCEGMRVLLLRHTTFQYLWGRWTFCQHENFNKVYFADSLRRLETTFQPPGETPAES